jgi:hypothetical protein
MFSKAAYLHRGLVLGVAPVIAEGSWLRAGCQAVIILLVSLELGVLL